MTDQAVVAYETEDVQQARRTARKVRTSYQPVDEFVKEIRDMQERSKDFLVPYKNLRCAAAIKQVLAADGVEDRHHLVLRLSEVPEIGEVELSLYEHVLTQLCQQTAIGDKSGVPTMYLKRLLSDNADRNLVSLAVVNVQELLGRRYGEKHTRGREGEEKAVFVRTFRMEDGSLRCRALLSDRYFPIRTLDMVMIALGLASGKIVPKDSGADSAITGAFMFDQHVSVTGCTAGFVNPNYAFDLKNPDRGIICAENVTTGEGGQPVFHYPGGASYALGGQFNMPLDGPKQHLVLPACRISNSETGGGSADIQPMLFEPSTHNCFVMLEAKRHRRPCWVAEQIAVTNRHSQSSVIEAQVKAISEGVARALSLSLFRRNAQRINALSRMALKSGRLRHALEYAIRFIPNNEQLLMPLLRSRHGLSTNRVTALDVVRALANVAQNQPHAVQIGLEELCGEFAFGEKTLPQSYLIDSASDGTPRQRPWPRSSAMPRRQP